MATTQQEQKGASAAPTSVTDSITSCKSASVRRLSPVTQPQRIYERNKDLQLQMRHPSLACVTAWRPHHPFYAIFLSFCIVRSGRLRSSHFYHHRRDERKGSRGRAELAEVSEVMSDDAPPCSGLAITGVAPGRSMLQENSCTTAGTRDDSGVTHHQQNPVLTAFLPRGSC